MNRRVGSVVAFSVLLAQAVYAETATAPAFDGPQVMKLGWDTSSLVSADFDGDDKNDLALLNNGQARIELLYRLAPGVVPAPSGRPVADTRWEPVLDDAPFQKASIVTGQTMHALATGDFNSDGRPDLAYTNDQGKLVFRFQGEDQSWNEKKEIELGGTLPYEQTMVSADVNRDGKSDLLVLTKKNLHLLLQGKTKGAYEQIRLPLADSETSGIRFADIDGDQREDIFYRGSAHPEFLTVRRQFQDGSFTREELLDMGGSPRSYVQPIDFHPPAGDAKEKSTGSVICIQEDTGLVEVSRLTSTEDPAGVGIKLPLQRYAIPNSSFKTSAFVIGNFLGASDGMPDVAVADGEGAQVWILESRGNDSFAPPVAFPTYAGVNDVAAIEFDGNPDTSELLVVSQKEKAVGVMSRPGPNDPLRYPTPLPCRGTPLAAAVIPEGERSGIACIVEDKGKRELLLLERKEADYAITQTLPLPEINSKPRALRVFDFNQDGRLDLLVFSPDEPMRVLLRMEDGTFGLFNDSQGLSGNLVDKLDASAVSFADFDGDGKSELLIARKRLVRALRIANGKVEVVAQFNADAENADFVSAVLLPDTSPKLRPLLVYDAARGLLVRAERDETGVFREKATAEARLRPNTAPLLSGDPGKLLLVSPADVHVTEIGTTKTMLSTISSYESDLEKTKPSWISVGKLGADPAPYVLLVDSSKTRVLEFLRPPDARIDGKRWQSLMHFPVFNQDPHYRGKTGGADEPHDVLMADVTNDGKPDIILLAHDRVLVYTSR